MKTMKRIQSITIKRMIDDSPDTSWLGEYSNNPNSDYSIDRAHSEDCNSIAYPREALAQLKHISDYLSDAHNSELYANDGTSNVESLSDACDLVNETIDAFEDCDCGEHGDMERNEYRYFNPNHENYTGCTSAEIRQYCKQDYERMESLNRGNWYFIGIAADAEIVVGNICQTVCSGGLWGIESDSHPSYFTEIEQEQLAELRSQLHALGFSKRAIATACKNVERTED